MIGPTEKSWSSLHNVVVPVLVAWIEASWASVFISALTNIGPHTRADIPFLTLAIPAMFAAAFVGYSGRLSWPTWCRTLAIVPVVLVSTALSAGIVGVLYLHGSFGTLSTHPWTVTGRVHGTEASLAWFVAALAIARGTWLGWEELSLVHAIRAVSVAALGFSVFFLIGALHHANASFHPQIGLAAVLLVLAFPAAMAVIALLNERELERAALRHRRSRPNLAWLGALVVPMAGVAAIGVILALGIGPLAPYVGRIIRAVALWVAAVIRYFARWLSHLFHATKSMPGHVGRASGPAVHQTSVTVHIPLWITIIASVIGAVIIAGLLFFVLRALIHMSFWSRTTTRLVSSPEEERESVFSWRHLGDQILQLVRRLFSRSHGRNGDGIAPSTAAPGSWSSAKSVRHHYRHLLVAARTAGHGRQIAETPFELEGRLSAVTGETLEAALREMTTAYEQARYGEEPDSDDRVERTGRAAALLVAALLETPSDSDE